MTQFYSAVPTTLSSVLSCQPLFPSEDVILLFQRLFQMSLSCVTVTIASLKVEFLSCGCYNKVLHTWWLQIIKIFLLTGLEAWTVKSKGRQGHVSSRSSRLDLVPCYFQLLVPGIVWLRVASPQSSRPTSANLFLLLFRSPSLLSV